MPRDCPDPPCLRARLRRETKEVHHRLHQHPLYAALLLPDLTEDGLDLALAATAQVLAWVEAQRVERDVFAELSLAPQLDRLRLDLGKKSIPPFSRNPPELKSDAAVLGALYTVLGSQFGGQAIDRHLRRKFPERTVRHYRHCASDAWGTLLQRLANEVPATADDVISGAVTAFKLVNVVGHDVLRSS